ncbi:MAG: low-specificity L-threonine aldolase [Acidobacteria bacterium]|nr:MAG: low-specificity L-threonine aldolase [Acidobacteriota bacterium]
MQEVVDLRSDTVTQPDEAMRAAMAAAPVGDDVYGEDPSVNALEARACEITGKEAALFVPSGSMANLIAQMVHARPGEAVLAGDESHCLLFEGGSGAAVAGLMYQVVAGIPQPGADRIADLLRPGDLHTPRTALVWVENTHNMAGGTVIPVEELERIAGVCRDAGVPLHMDGARLFNAAVATGVPIRRWASCVDSLSFALSKGLGAPVGSVLCGDAAFRARALRLRKMLGGGMRQAGILAAAGLHALEHNVGRLAEDHRNAARLARALAGHPRLAIDLQRVQTNIVMAEVIGGEAEELARRCAERGVLFHALGARRVRFVTHLGVSAADVDRALAVIREALDDLPGG